LTDPTILAIIAAVPPTLLALAAFMQSFKNNILSKDRSAKTNAKIDEVHVLANSNLTRVRADLAVALKRIETLEGHIADFKPQE
jgi:hypothetical protein